MELKRALGLAALGLACVALWPQRPLAAASIEVTPQAAAEGTLGLRVHFGPDCAAGQTLELDAADGPLQGTYEACRTITAAAVAVSAPGATLRAGDGIELGAGFRVEHGATFDIVLDGGLSGGPTDVRDLSPIAETVYTARFSERLDNLVLAAGESIGALVAYSGGGETIFRVTVEPATGGGLQLALEALQDGGGMVQTPPGQEISVPAGWHTVDLAWSAGPGTGRLELAIDGGAPSGLVDLDNAAALIETIRWGAVDGAIFTASGSIDLDTYASTR